MNTWVLRITMTLALISLPAFVAAQPWSDDFDAYANGSGLHGQGGWRAWDGNTAFDAFVTDVQSRSAPHSADIILNADIVQQFVGANAGEWTIGGYCYIPSGSTGQQFFILLNDYNEGGAKNWSSEIVFDSNTGFVFDNSGAGTAYPIINDQWVELRVEIDFNANDQDTYYGNQLVSTKSWTEGSSGGGALNLEALDLFSNNGSSIYWDDLTLLQPPPVSIEEVSWGEIKSRFR
jgi:hypothetical protein